MSSPEDDYIDQLNSYFKDPYSIYYDGPGAVDLYADEEEEQDNGRN